MRLQPGYTKYIFLFILLLLTLVPIPSILTADALCKPCSVSDEVCPRCPQKGDIVWQPSLLSQVLTYSQPKLEVAKNDSPVPVIANPTPATLKTTVDLGRFQATITKSPTQPVCREGESCSSPFAYEVLNIFAATGGDSVATVTTDTEGKINVALPPGSYYLQSATPAKMGTLPRNDFTITSGQTTSISLEVDTGIR